MLMAAISASDTIMPLGYWPVSSSQRTVRPVLGGGGRDQLDDDAIADERLGAPVLADEGEEPMFDFVPLAGAGRQVADHDVEAELVGQLLEFALPQPHPRAVAAASVGGDQQSGGVGIACPTDGLPPLADAIHGKGDRVMVNADTHPTRIGSEVIDPVRHRAAELLDQEVMDPNRFRVALRAIFAAMPVIDGIRSRKSCSHQTPRWREGDSNSRSPQRRTGPTR